MSDLKIRLWPGWEVVRELGKGSYGKVYEINRRNGDYLERSALKIIHVPENPAELEQLRMNGLTEEGTGTYLWRNVEKIRKEIGLMQQFVGYTNIVSYEDYLIEKQENGVGWDILIRMELLTPLPEYMKSNPFSEKEVLKMGLDISQALIICHGTGILHRDIKPQNIFVNKRGFFKLGDFGISRAMPDSSKDLSFKGTVSYMAPETFSMRGTDARSDIYSLALVLYRILNEGREPFLNTSTFTPEDLEAARNRRLSGELLPAPRAGSSGLRSVLMTALSPDPALRYQTAEDFHTALKNVAEGRPDDSGSKWNGSKPDGGGAKPDGKQSDSLSRSTNWLKKATGGEDSGRSGSIPPEKRKLLIAVAALCAGLIVVILFYYAFMASRKAGSALGDRLSKEFPQTMHVHQWEEATCTDPKTCTICGKTSGEALGHDWKEATCTEPKTCSICGATEGTAPGHDWKDATCTEPKTCSVCGITDGPAPGHDWEEATCTEPKTCRKCGITEGTAPGHDWIEATYDNPKTCARCGETQGNVKGYIPYYVLKQGSYSEDTFEEHDYKVHPWVFADPIKKCRKIKIGYGVKGSKGDPRGIYECWARSDDKWKMIGTINVKEEEKLFDAIFAIDPPMDIDAVLFEPQERKTGEFEWASQYEFYEAQGELPEEEDAGAGGGDAGAPDGAGTDQQGSDQPASANGGFSSWRDISVLLGGMEIDFEKTTLGALLDGTGFSISAENQGMKVKKGDLAIIDLNTGNDRAWLEVGLENYSGSEDRPAEQCKIYSLILGDFDTGSAKNMLSAGGITCGDLKEDVIAAFGTPGTVEDSYIAYIYEDYDFTIQFMFADDGKTVDAIAIDTSFY